MAAPDRSKDPARKPDWSKIKAWNGGKTGKESWESTQPVSPSWQEAVKANKQTYNSTNSFGE